VAKDYLNWSQYYRVNEWFR